MEDDLEVLKANDARLREELGLDKSGHSEAAKRVRERIQRIADSRAEEPPEEEFEASERAAERSMEERTQSLRNSRGEKWDSKVPPRWSQWNMDRLPKQFRMAANEWIAEGFNDARNLILLGPTGSGKTSIAYAIGREIYILGHKVKIWQAAELFDEMRTQEKAQIVLESVKNAELLILDDLGSERKTEWVEERLFLIIDYRWQWQLPIIVTTNLTNEEFSTKLSERISSRLRDNAMHITVTGKDYRA